MFNIEARSSAHVDLGREEKQSGDVGAALETMARMAARQGEKLTRPGARVTLPNQIGTTLIIKVRHSWTKHSLNYSAVTSISVSLYSYVVGAANCLKPSI